MKYSLINKQKGESVGFTELTHKVIKDYMIVNENELAKHGDPAEVAEKLGGTLMTLAELQNERKKLLTSN